MANDGIDNLIPVRSKEEAREKVEELFSTTTFKVEDIEQLITKEEDKSKELQDIADSLAYETTEE